MTAGHIAVIDIGKTNAKLALVERATGAEVAVTTTPNTVLTGPPWPHFDVDRIWAFLIRALTEMQATHGIDAISVTTHGASVALLGADGDLAALILDYEHSGPDEVSAAYDRLRPPFADTGSPRLTGGLNVGAQLHWQFQTEPGLLERTAHVVTYPQYWGHRFTGTLACDVTSLGCHTDLWNPYAGAPSTLVADLGLDRKLAPPRKPADVLGPVRPEISRATGLDPATPVHCGIHDSNASLLPHLMREHAPFSVVSTGTWVVVMAVGASTVTLDPARDTLVNVNAWGDPVPSARFMGGREFDILTGGQIAEPTSKDVTRVLASKTMLLPAVVPDTGPFCGRIARWQAAEPPLGSAQRQVAIGFYLALMTATCLRLVGHRGTIHVEGPFAQDDRYLQMLSVAMNAPVIASASATGTSQGAALLAGATQPKSAFARVTSADVPYRSDMASYACAWDAATGS